MFTRPVCNSIIIPKMERQSLLLTSPLAPWLWGCLRLPPRQKHLVRSHHYLLFSLLPLTAKKQECMEGAWYHICPSRASGLGRGGKLQSLAQMSVLRLTCVFVVSDWAVSSLTHLPWCLWLCLLTLNLPLSQSWLSLQYTNKQTGFSPWALFSEYL